VCNWLAKEFIEKFDDEHVNKQDRFGRTALHYAAIEGNNELIDVLKRRSLTTQFKIIIRRQLINIRIFNKITARKCLYFD